MADRLLQVLLAARRRDAAAALGGDDQHVFFMSPAGKRSPGQRRLPRRRARQRDPRHPRWSAESSPAPSSRPGRGRDSARGDAGRGRRLGRLGARLHRRCPTDPASRSAASWRKLARGPGSLRPRHFPRRPWRTLVVATSTLGPGGASLTREARNLPAVRTRRRGHMVSDEGMMSVGLAPCGSRAPAG